MIRSLRAAFALVLVLFLGPAVTRADEAAPDRPLRLRCPAVSPDGAMIACCYRGQLWVVPPAGGDALPLTSGLFHAQRPVWSPDGKPIAFASSRYGNLDIFVMVNTGGKFHRLTHHFADDLPCPSDLRRVMPAIEWSDPPEALRKHLFLRAAVRQISGEDLLRPKAWRESRPEAPEGPWYKDFGSFNLCGEGRFPKTFPLRGQAAKGTRP